MAVIYCDAHIHAPFCVNLENAFPPADFLPHYACCSCSHSKNEFFLQENLKRISSLKLVSAFGVHPQNPDPSLVDFLESLLRDGRLDAIGELGFDFFTEDFRSHRAEQEEVWEKCIDLALSYSLPVIVHNRKALDLMFRDYKKLAGLKSVVFHSFAFGSREALSLLDKGLNASFTFGKPLLKGAKKSIDCVANLPLEKILLETDAPFQTLRGETFTPASHISLVYDEAAKIRGLGLDELSFAVAENFSRAFFCTL
ncbi:MAG: TatD family hydrolase [Treponema sp.]|nr:TatD family hydrolase [Treponema sp.]